MVFSPTRPSCIFPSDIFFSKGPDCIGCTSCDATGAPPSALFLTLSIFWCPFAKKFQVAANRTILIPEGLPMAHLKAYVPNFSKLTRKRS